MDSSARGLASPRIPLDLSKHSHSADGLKRLRILPWGTVESKSGRFHVTDEGAREILKNFRNHGVSIPVDVEHVNLSARIDEERKAVGWVERLEVEPGVGVFGYFRWTDRAIEWIRNDEFRYLSPVILMDVNDRALEIMAVGLTNYPAMPGVQRVAASRLERMKLAMSDVPVPEQGLTDDPGVLAGQIAAAVGVELKKGAGIVDALLAILNKVRMTGDPSKAIANADKPDAGKPGSGREVVGKLAAALKGKGVELADDATPQAVLQAVLDFIEGMDATADDVPDADETETQAMSRFVGRLPASVRTILEVDGPSDDGTTRLALSAIGKSGDAAADRREVLLCNRALELKAFFQPYEECGALHRADEKFCDHERRRSIVALAFRSKHLATIVLEGYKALLPPQGRTVAPDRATTDRMTVIRQACREYLASGTPHSKLTSVQAFVNMRLADKHQGKLTDEELREQVMPEVSSRTIG